jgi:hypothetical protein
MTGIGLDPVPVCIMVINVIPIGLLPTATRSGNLVSVSLVPPVFIKGKDLVYLHGIDELACDAVSFRTGSKQPIANLSLYANLLLAGSKSACAMERIGGKTDVVSHYIAE